MDDYVAANGRDALGEYVYYNLGGWTKYEFEGVQRRDFLYSDSDVAGRTVYAGHREKYVFQTNESASHFSHPEYMSTHPDTTVDLWAGFVLIKESEPVEVNEAPLANLSVMQGGKLVASIDPQGGTVTATVNISDSNQADTHAVAWQVGTSPLVDLANDDSDATFEFDPSSLADGGYRLTAQVTESNTTDAFSLSVDSLLVVNATVPTLSADTDSDNDGVSDADEGLGDTDGDGIVDYLDSSDVMSELPLGPNSKMLKTTDGLTLSLGDVSRAALGTSASTAAVSLDDVAQHGGTLGEAVDNTALTGFQAVGDIINFNVAGLSQAGESVSVVVPLPTGVTIPEQAVYRKYTEANGWFDFVVDANNSVKSAAKDDDGNCPAPASDAYQDGLTFGDGCVQLTIQDGGANDADGLSNGLIKDPGVIVFASDLAPVIDVQASVDAMEQTTVSLDASNSSDPEGGALTYSWTQTGGDSVTLTAADTATVSFDTPNVTSTQTLTFQVQVSDGNSNPTADVTVTVQHENDAPAVVIASHDSVFNEGDFVSLTADASDLNGDSLTYQWELVSGPSVTLADADSESVSFTAPWSQGADQTLELKVTVSDGTASVSSNTSVTVAGVEAPEADSDGGSMGWTSLLLALGLLRRKKA